MNNLEYSFQRQVQTVLHAEVIVIGGGPAGTAAAISAARCGKQVVLLEKSAQLGGMGTLANVSVFMPIGNVTGIYREIIAEMLAESLPQGHDESIAPQYSPFLMRQYMNEKMKKSRCRYITMPSSWARCRRAAGSRRSLSPPGKD